MADITPASTASPDVSSTGLQSALISTLCTLGAIPGLASATGRELTHLDRALLDVVRTCAGMLVKRHFLSRSQGIGGDDEAGLKQLEKLLEEIVGRARTMGGEEKGKGEDDGWVDVGREDVLDHPQLQKGEVAIRDFYFTTATARMVPLEWTLRQIRGACSVSGGFARYEIVDAEERTRPFVDEQDWENRRRAGMELVLVGVLDGLRAVRRGMCPVPGCGAGGDGAVVEVCEEGGWICNECGVWFDQGLEPLMPVVATEVGTISHQRIWKEEPEPQLPPQAKPSLFRNFPARNQPSMEDLRMFKFVKTYPLINLDKRVDDERESGEQKMGMYKCQKCSTHLALEEEIISRNFRGIHGKACLFDKLYNVTIGEKSEREMTTGKHVAVDVHCRQCREYVGWAYEHAERASEGYKVGKFILEMEVVVKDANSGEGNETMAEVQRRLTVLQMREKRRNEQSGILKEQCELREK